MPARKKGEGSMMNAGFLRPTGLQAPGGRKMQGREEKDEGEGENKREESRREGSVCFGRQEGEGLSWL